MWEFMQKHLIHAQWGSEIRGAGFLGVGKSWLLPRTLWHMLSIISPPSVNSPSQAAGLRCTMWISMTTACKSSEPLLLSFVFRRVSLRLLVPEA